ncbi:MAG: hypothetical protein Fur0015_13240 [Ignavibacteriales bacterium]
MDLSEGIRLFNDHDFFSAHDYFENIWNECDKNDKLFLQGLVQVSVGSYHIVCGNLNGAESQLKKAKSKLGNYLPKYLTIDSSSLIDEIQTLITEIKFVKAKQKTEINLELLPTIKQIY